MAVTQNCLFTVEQRSIHRAYDWPTALMPLYIVTDEMLFEVASTMKFSCTLICGSLSVALTKVALRGLALERQRLRHNSLYRH